ncbi:MAG: hypothetical protein ACI9VS_003533 [Candidatus Binatia bacterium]|jgi:hypothetical protein
MKIQLGRDDHPVLDQFSEEGFVDLTFEMVDLVADEDYYRFHLAASFDDQVVGMGVVVQKGIKAGFDSNMDLNKEHVYHRGVRFFRAGEQSDRLVCAITRLYGADLPAARMVDEEAFTAIALHQDAIDLTSERVKLKIFGNDGEPFNEEAYYESFFNIDLSHRLVFWNEKDQDYRAPLLRGLSLRA